MTSTMQVLIKQASFYKECTDPQEVLHYLGVASECYHIDAFQVIPSYGRLHLFVVGTPYQSMPRGARPIGSSKIRELER